MARTTFFALLSFIAGSAAVKGTIISEEPRIEYRPGFLNTAQVAALRSLATAVGLQPTGAATREINGGDDYAVLSAPPQATNPGDPAEEGWAAVQSFQASASKWTRFPAGRASAPVVTRWETQSPESDLNRSGAVHLDARWRPRRQKTVLAFLSGGDGAPTNGPAKVSSKSVEDGLLVFPCLETDDMEDEEATRRRTMCSRAHTFISHAYDRLRTMKDKGAADITKYEHDFFEGHPEVFSLPEVDENGEQPVVWQWDAAFDHIEEDPAVWRHNELFELAESMCRGEAGGVRVAPVAGSALMLETGRKGAKGKVSLDWMLWHTGCSPATSSQRRWTIQVFFEASSSNPGRRSAASKSEL